MNSLNISNILFKATEICWKKCNISRKCLYCRLVVLLVDQKTHMMMAHNRVTMADQDKNFLNNLSEDETQCCIIQRQKPVIGTNVKS